MKTNQQISFRTAVERLVEYLWDDEEQDYRQQPPEQRQQHIFASLRRAKYWLNQVAAKRNEHEEFGHCPRCGGNDGYFNSGRAHFFHCQLCRTKWGPGENLFSSWRRESESDWKANEERFGHYTEVEPVHRWSVEQPAATRPSQGDAAPQLPLQRRVFWLAGVVLLAAAFFLLAAAFFLPELLAFAAVVHDCQLCCE